jgi:glycine dehydrogenase subunit 1
VFAKPIHQNQSLLIVSADPIALGILKAPGELGADIVVGDGQALGNGLHFGGPSLGFLAAHESFMRRMPGRIVGETVDNQKERRFVLTIQTREQHIRREKATSNICTNQSLNALKAAIYMALMGPGGLARTAELCIRKSHDLYQRLLKLEGFSPAYTGPFFKSFTLRFDGDLKGLNRHLLDKGFLGGLDLGQLDSDWEHIWLLAVTEKRTDSEINAFIHTISQFIKESGVSA